MEVGCIVVAGRVAKKVANGSQREAKSGVANKQQKFFRMARM
jgi:hypothetical protein